MENYNCSSKNEVNYITEEDVKIVLENSGYGDKDCVLEEYVVYNASDKMLGLLGDYWKLKVILTDGSHNRTQLSLFIKSVSRSNDSKANLVKELKLFEKEMLFYTVINRSISFPGLKPWSAKFVAALDDAIVFEDLNALHYVMRNKFERFDKAHTQQALRTLANFHAATIIFEEKRKNELQRPFTIIEEYNNVLNTNGFTDTSPWFVQCKTGALEAIKVFSKYSKDRDAMEIIERRWEEVWSCGLALAEVSPSHKNVITHGDLWNNNILFHYKEVEGVLVPDDCLLVDFQGARIRPLTSDIMYLLYCTLEPKFREENMSMFLNYYYQEISAVLYNYGISVENVFTLEDFLASAEKQKLWGLLLCSCMLPQFWVDDDLTKEIFSDSNNFKAILENDKGSFIKKMMQSNEDYKNNVLVIFDEVVEKYCL